MNVELKPIAESKVRQLGGDVCGVMVRKDDKLAAVDEHGRVQWLQSGQGAEVVAVEYQHEDTGQIGYVDLQQVEWGFFKNNPRLQEIGPVFRHPPKVQAVPVAWIEEYELESLQAGFTLAHVRRDDGRSGLIPLYTHTQPTQQGSVPEGWSLTHIDDPATDGYLVKGPGISYCAWKDKEPWLYLFCEALASATPQPEGDGCIPKGWKLVPVEPTPEMREAFFKAQEECEDFEGVYGPVMPDHQYSAMLSVAPQPPQEGEGDE